MRGVVYRFGTSVATISAGYCGLTAARAVEKRSSGDIDANEDLIRGKVSS